ncbi:hypothetical protein [Pontibacter fetidus]|uniref:Uncharacterized protein n=1 Tax=Pontibacter fetidus TaxID=2700082 RepID=A0A6B2H6B7_9BACT|nr:hypothetical protein [Pontibacter fetidus]NDK55887.1 hypothetical protein [Pontibacter fetidus]
MATHNENEHKPDNVKNINNDFSKRVSMDNRPDPSAKRNVGPGGTLERAGQKDKLENMHIQGNETTGYGATGKSSTNDYLAQGPGFEAEGSDTAMDNNHNGIRNKEQPFGENNTEPDGTDHSRT